MADTATASPALDICQLPPTFESLGLVADLLSEFDTFDTFEFAPLIRTLSAQVQQRHHVCAFSGQRLVGYCGLLPVRAAQARLWLDGRAVLDPAPPGGADAMALTVVAVREARALRPLIRFCRQGFPDTQVFFKRSYGGGKRPARKCTVKNCVIAF